jgi:hypothetical protein
LTTLGNVIREELFGGHYEPAKESIQCESPDTEKQDAIAEAIIPRHVERSVQNSPQSPLLFELWKIKIYMLDNQTISPTNNSLMVDRWLAYGIFRFTLGINIYSSIALAAYSALELEILRQRHRAHLPALRCRMALFIPSWLFYHSRRPSWVG